MHWFPLKHRPSKWLQSKQRKNPGKTNNSDDRQTDIGALIEPTQPSGIASEPTRDTEHANNTNVSLNPTQNPGDTTASSEPEDLWAKAEQRLAQDEKTGPILKKAIEIIEEAGLKTGPHGTADHQQLRNFLGTKVDELKKKEWKVRFDDRCIGVRDQLFKVIRNILVLKDVINAAASASPPAAIACAGLTVSLLLFVQAADQKDSLLKGLEKTSILIPQLHMRENLYLRCDANVSNDFMDKFKEGLVSLYCKIVEFQARALCFLQKNVLSQVSRNMFKQDQWDELIQSITGQEADAQSFTRLIDSAESKSNREKILQCIEQAFEKHLLWQSTSDREEKVNKFFKSFYLCPYKDRKDRNDDRVLGTCEWFTSHPLFQQWDQKQNDDSSLLWVSADPGCGKSVLSKYLVDEVLPSVGNRTICYFFFRDDYPDQNKSTIALASIIRQLFMSQSHLLSDSVLNQFDQDGQKLVESFRKLWNILMSVTASGSSGEIICVMDALDECQEDDRNELIGAVRDLYLGGHNNRKLKFFCTSRPYGHIGRGFRELENRMPTIHLSGESPAEVDKISHEIDLVIMKRVQDIGIEKDLEQDERDFLQEKLTEIPNRTYLWVTLTIDYIQGLDGFTKGEVRETVHDKIPISIDKAYDKILSKSKDQRKAKHLLHIVLAAKRPLSVEELSLAMALKREGQSHDDIREGTEPVKRFATTLRDLCGLILVVVDNKVYLLHQTVKEFLVQNLSQSDNYVSPNNWKHALAVHESNKVLAKICVWYLYAASTEFSPQYLLDYSTRYWPDHFCKASFLHHDRMTMLAKDLCVPRSELYYTWANVHDGVSGFPQSPTAYIIASYFGFDGIVQQLLKESGVDIDSKDSKYHRTPLSWAARNGHEAVVKLLLATGEVDIDSKDSQNMTPLSWAARNGQEIVVGLLLATGEADIDSKDSQNQTPLSCAAMNGHEAVVRLLLDTGKVDIDARDFQNRTPLSWAAWNGHETVVKPLLNTRKVDINSKDSENRTPLSCASWRGHESVVRLLLADTHGEADINSRGSQNRTPLSCAAQNGHETVVKLLLNTKKVDINSKDSQNQTPLSCAARRGHGAVVRLLLAYTHGEADIDSRDSQNRTPLSWAAMNGHETVVGLLLDTGKADINSKDLRYGRTPLLWAAQDGHETVVRQLLATGEVNINSRDSQNQTPLLWAAQYGHETVARLLLDTGKVDINSKDSQNRTPLSWAARNGRETVVGLLLATGEADIDSKDSQNWTPLSWAAQYGHETVVRLLLDTGTVDINSKDAQNRTPLSWAARNGHETVVGLILKTGEADIDSKDSQNQTPLSCAAMNGHEAVVRLLLDTGKVDIDARDFQNRTPLSWAAQDGHETVIRLLLATGKVDINSKDSQKQTPLSWADVEGHETVVKLLHDTMKSLETAPVA